MTTNDPRGKEIGPNFSDTGYNPTVSYVGGVNQIHSTGPQWVTRVWQVGSFNLCQHFEK
jgi:hypothetical protein